MEPFWRTSVITDSPRSFYPKIQSNYRLPLGRAQGGAFCRRARRVLQPACAHTRTARPHIYKRDHRIDSTFSLRICGRSTELSGYHAPLGKRQKTALSNIVGSYLAAAPRSEPAGNDCWPSLTHAGSRTGSEAEQEQGCISQHQDCKYLPHTITLTNTQCAFAGSYTSIDKMSESGLDRQPVSSVREVACINLGGSKIFDLAESCNSKHSFKSTRVEEQT
jgi:hypothetical protein